MNTRTKILFVVLALFVSGCSCAKKSELDAVRAELNSTKKIAEQALNTANEAQQSAQSAETRAKQANEAVSRGFKKSMYK